MSNRTLIYHIIWVIIVLAIGFGIVGFFTMGAERATVAFGEKTTTLQSYIRSLVNKKTDPIVQFTEPDTKPFEIQLGNVSDTEFVPPAKGKVIRANLRTMSIELFENGKLKETLMIINKGKAGSYWETPGGTFEVTYKEINHFSTFGEVWMPYSVHFFGNFFIHGEPYDNTGKKFTSLYSGGSIRLADSDAKKVFEWADQDTIVSVYSDSPVSPARSHAGSGYFIRNPNKPLPVSAKAYVIGDLDTGEIIFEKNKSTVYPIASVSKLITSLVSLDFLNQSTDTTVSRTALAAYGTQGALRLGEKFSIGNLLYPLILESSNDAAEVIAESYGRTNFIDNMNKKVTAIGMMSTSFKDPSGLSPGNVSTAEDLLRLAIHIKDYKSDIFEISKLSKKTIGRHTWYNNSQMTRKYGYVGGKSGYTPEAEKTIVAAFTLPLSEFGARNIGITFLQSDDRLGDVDKILAYVKENIFYSARDRAEIVAAITGSGFAVPVPPPATEEATIAFVGDMMFDRGVTFSVNKNFGGDYGKLFASLGFFRDYDILFGNLEGPVSDIGNDLGNLYSFRMNPAILPIVRSAGFDVLSIANNHIGDWGRDAFDDTLARLGTSGIEAIGGGRNKSEASQPKIIERNGLKIGFLGFSDVGPDWLAATEEDSGILLVSDPHFEEIIKTAAKDVDALIISIHWGEEYQATTEHQKEIAHRAIDAGARLVIGHHPHVIQETESYENGYIAYSLGNLIFDQGFSKETMQGMLLEVTIKKGEISGVGKKLVKFNEKFQPYRVTEMEEGGK